MYNHQLDAFIASAEAGSFSKAAERLFISPPALLKQIKLLEGKLNVRLFDRTHNGVSLTPAGEKLYSYSKKIVKLCNDAEADIVKTANLNNSIEIGIVYPDHCKLLNSLLSNIKKQIPNSKLNFKYIPENSLPSNMSFDVMECIYMDNFDPSTYKFKEFYRTGICLGIPYSHPLSNLPQHNLEDLDSCTILIPFGGVSYVARKLSDELNAIGCNANIVTDLKSIPASINYCEENNCILLMADVYSDVFVNLSSSVLNSDIEVPYGLIYHVDNTNPLIEEFVSTAFKCYKQ